MQMLYAINALCIIRHSKQEEHQGFNTPLGSPLPCTRAPRKRGDATQKAPQGILQRPATQPANYGEPVPNKPKMPRLYPYGQQKLDLQSQTAGLPGFLGGGPKSGSAGRTCAQPDFFGEIFCLYQLGFITGSRKSRYLALPQGGKRRHSLSLSYGEYFQRSGRVREPILFPCFGV